MEELPLELQKRHNKYLAAYNYSHKTETVVSV